MKRLKILVAVLALLTLTACSPGETELKQRLVIEGIGVDYEEGEYVLTVQALSDSASASSGQEGSSASAVNYTTKGETIAFAVKSLCDVTGKNPMYSQNRIIVFGSELDAEQLMRGADHFLREYTARPDVLLAAAAGSAQQVLTVEDGSGVTAKTIAEAISESSKNSIGIETKLYSAVNLYMEEGTAFAVPLLEVTKDRSGDGDSVKVTGSKIYSESGENSLSSDETMFFLFAAGLGDRGTVSITVDKVRAALDITSVKTKTKTEIKEGKPTLTVTLKCDADLVEYGSDSFKSVGDSRLKEIEKAAGAYFREGLEAVIKRETQEENADPFRFGKRLLLKDKELYEKLIAEDGGAVGAMDITVKATVSVSKVGQSSFVSK